jgi:hypothetical protein
MFLDLNEFDILDWTKFLYEYYKYSPIRLVLPLSCNVSTIISLILDLIFIFYIIVKF